MVKATHCPLGGTDLIGRVESFHDWWVMVKMRSNDTVVPYMEQELTTCADKGNSKEL